MTAVGVVIEVRRQYLDDLDRSLRQRAEQIIAAHEALPEQALVDSNAEDRFAQVVDRLGVVVASTPNIDATAPLAPPPNALTAVSDRDDLPIEDDAYRVLTLVGPNGGYVIVGENVDDVHDDVRVLMATLAVAFPLAVVALGAAMWWLVGRTLRPVELIRTEVAGIGLDDLHRRVEVPRSNDEIALLASTMNDMLARLDRSVAQQRTLVADASHELRTPLTRLRTALEVDLAAADPAGELTGACRGALAEVISMQQLVDDLLFLARRDAREPGQPDPRTPWSTWTRSSRSRSGWCESEPSPGSGSSARRCHPWWSPAGPANWGASSPTCCRTPFDMQVAWSRCHSRDEATVRS